VKITSIVKGRESRVHEITRPHSKEAVACLVLEIACKFCLCEIETVRESIADY
jgi:hypothetical protein